MEWLKLNDHRELYIQISDKVRVRDYVLEKTENPKILNKIFRIYDSSSEIVVDDLPAKFAIKTNNNCGGNFFCSSKDSFDAEMRIEFDKLLNGTSSSKRTDKPATTASYRKSSCQFHGNKFPGIEFQQLKSFILNRRRFGTQDESMFGMRLGRYFHQAASGQALQQRTETADGVAIVGFLAVGFAFGRLGDLRLFDR